MKYFFYLPAYQKTFNSSTRDNIRFAVLFNEIAEFFPMKKFDQLKDFILSGYHYFM